MEIVNCNIFQKWVSHSKDYIFKGGTKPLNHFPQFFNFYVYENTTYINKPDQIIKKKSNFSSIGLFQIKCPWYGFSYESISNFNLDTDILYFARDKDYLEINNNEAIYEINLNLSNHICKIVFCMPNVEMRDDSYNLLYTRIFIPKLDLDYIDPINQFQIKYNQNKNGVGIEDTNSNHISKSIKSHFYFNKPFYIYIYIDLINLLSIYIESIK